MAAPSRPGLALAVAALVAAFAGTTSLATLAQPAAKVPKQCAAARNHVAQQRKAIADIDSRIDKEQRSRFACGSSKACRRYDQRIESIEKRKAEHEAQLARLQAAEAKACTGY